MATLLSCPPELRQQILSHCLPSDVHNAGVAPRTAPLLPLLLTCRAIHLDVLEVIKTWSPLYHIEDPVAFFTNTTKSRRRRRLYVDDDDDDVSHMRSISLRLFASLDLKLMRSSIPKGAVDDAIFDVAPWLLCASSLPPTAQSVVVDLTPAPAWLALRRPDWVRSTVLDGRNRVFLENCAPLVRRLLGELGQGGLHGVPVLLGGVVSRKARRIVEVMMQVRGGGGPAGAVRFAGEWLGGPVEVPTRLSLGLLCRCWGVDVGSLETRSWSLEPGTPRMIQVRNEARKEGLTTPDLDLGTLGHVSWSKNSCSAYYINAEEDEGRTREELVRLLGFAVGVGRTAGAVPPGAVVDFAPAIRARRFLLHCLARDLGLASVSVGDAGEKFVRVSHVVGASVEGRESLESGGGEDGESGGGEDVESGGGDDVHVNGEGYPVVEPWKLRLSFGSCCA